MLKVVVKVVKVDDKGSDEGDEGGEWLILSCLMCFKD